MATHSRILAGEFHVKRSLAGYSPWGHKESGTTEQLNNNSQVLASSKCSEKTKLIFKAWVSLKTYVERLLLNTYIYVPRYVKHFLIQNTWDRINLVLLEYLEGDTLVILSKAQNATVYAICALLTIKYIDNVA